MSETPTRRIAATRYLVFAGTFRNSRGGWGDFIAAFEREEEAVECAANVTPFEGWSQVVDVGKLGRSAIIATFPKSKDAVT